MNGQAPFPDGITIGDKYGPAMKIKDQAEADAYFARCVEHTLQFVSGCREEAERVERINLGYYAGYCDHETRKRVERLFQRSHPVFGKIEEVGAPTAQEAMQAGLDWAKGRRA